MFDTHTHLNSDQLYPDWQMYMANFVDAGWLWIVNIGMNPIANKRAIDIACQSAELFPSIIVSSTVGIHPCEVVDNRYTRYDIWYIQDHIAQLIQHNHNNIVAIGEAWIDLHYEWSSGTLDDQQLIFDLQCRMAVEYKVPLVVHSRDAYQETMDVLIKYPSLRVVMHCRWYTPWHIKNCLSLLPSCWIGYTGTITYPKALDIRESLLVTPLDRILLETDAPYLAPQVMRWSMNQPSYLAHIYSFVAQIFWQPDQSFIDTIRKNVSDFYLL